MDIDIATGITIDPKPRMGAAERALLDQYVAGENQKINEGKPPSQDLQMNDFLKLLTTQLTHQDPSAPMEDKEFISQMAQMSSLKQMTTMAQDISRLTAIFSGSEATAALGKQVELIEGDRVVQGTVKAVTRGGEPDILVEGSFYPWKQVSKVFD